MKALVVYWSGTGNTENMASGICDGMRSAGVEVTQCRVDQIEASNALKYDKIALGCPAMGSEALEEREFEPFFSKIEDELKGKSVVLFGSYGWGDGEWMRKWARRVSECGAILYGDGLIINQASDSAYEVSFDYGKAFGGI